MNLFLIFWLACGLTTAVVAHHYGANQWRWLAGGLVFGPFALALSFGSGNDRTCAHCRKHIDRGALTCPHCRQDISDTALSAPIYICDSCSFRSGDRPAFCPNCKEPFRQREGSQDPLIEHRNLRVMYSWFAVWVMILGGAGLYAFMDDPTAGHFGRVVYPDESVMDSRNPSSDIPGRRTFRIAKDDRVVKIPDVPTKSPARVWVRITTGTHAGRSGVVIW